MTTTVATIYDFTDLPEMELQSIDGGHCFLYWVGFGIGAAAGLAFDAINVMSGNY